MRVITLEASVVDRFEEMFIAKSDLQIAIEHLFDLMSELTLSGKSHEKNYSLEVSAPVDRKNSCGDENFSLLTKTYLKQNVLDVLKIKETKIHSTGKGENLLSLNSQGQMVSLVEISL